MKSTQTGRHSTAIAWLAALLFLIGCASSEQAGNGPVTTVAARTAAPQERPAEPDAGDTGDSGGFPDVVAMTASGGQLDFGSLDGQDTVLWFWAPW